MAQPAARIRPVEADDQKFIKFLVGKACMEPLTVANKKLYFHPLVLSAWVGLACVFAEFMNWWPKPEFGVYGYLSPIPAFGSLAIVFMFGIDWLNRWGFEDRSAHVLRRPDMVDIPAYYSRSPSSGFWVLQYGERFVGIIAIDASLDADSDNAVANMTFKKDTSGKVALSKGTAQTATIRHFFVEDQYRPAGTEDDLLEFALRHAFTNDAKVETVRAYASPLESYIGNSLRKHGFALERKTEKVGALRWQNSTQILTRERWADVAEQR
ncbi:hypothetical protein GSI_06718 [Ganoderma sinense ZZ0214-1]|uniref:N-acetyltransferase domain-containing protein n=1 Tax=Ganoderma sinense ZZ0214-1 TaxID=1077348 RepID=A0A2G8SE18_9APHY|nr:hypothetical protein GSI_06718 [Ganoderma sinense ZZ0214-1]